MKKKILIISPHPDDETISLGGAIAKFVNEGSEVTVLTLSGHLPPLYKKEVYDKTVNEAKKAYEILGVKDSKFYEIPATMVSEEPTHQLNLKISSMIREFNPQVVLVPFLDRHIDHRVIFDASLVATRPVNEGTDIEIVAAYETLSETHWVAPYIEPNFIPNWIIDITPYIETKLEALKCFESQISPFPGPRSLEAVEALAKFRGTQAGFSYGEGLSIIRMIT